MMVVYKHKHNVLVLMRDGWANKVDFSGDIQSLINETKLHCETVIISTERQLNI
jgi:hypothetical protein